MFKGEIMENNHLRRQLSPMHVWAIAFGCVIGWGSFINPGKKFLSTSGVAGTAIAMILGALVSTYSDMYRAKVVAHEGGQQRDLKKLFPQAYKSDFKLRNAFRRAGRFSMPALRKSLELLAEADTKLKSTSEDHRTVFEKLMIELALARRQKA